ncbi:MAG: sugar ABC transporter permease [Chloroflexota bacterium]
MAEIDVAGTGHAQVKRLRGRVAGQLSFVYGSLGPLMAYMMFFSLLPILWAVALGFFDYSPVRVGGGFLGLGGANSFVGLANYRAMFTETQPARVFRLALFNTFIFACLVLPLNLAITLPLAVLVDSVHDRFKGLFRAIYFLPTITSTAAVALIWQIIYLPQTGLLHMLIKGIGLTPPRNWLVDAQTTVLGIPIPLIAIIIAYLWQDFGYNLVIFIAALQAIPRDFHDAAMVDGANPWHEFWRITLPLLKPTLLFVCVLTMLSSLQVFSTIYVMYTSNPPEYVYTLMIEIYQNAFRYQNMGWAAAIAMVLFLIIAGFTFFQFRFLRTDWEY